MFLSETFNELSFASLKTKLLNDACKSLYFWDKDAVFGAFTLNLEKPGHTSSQNHRICKIWTTNSLFRYFWAVFLKNHCHTRYQLLQICQNKKVVKKKNFSNLGSKNVFWNFSSSKFKNRSTYLKSTPSNLSNC